MIRKHLAAFATALVLGTGLAAVESVTAPSAAVAQGWRDDGRFYDGRRAYDRRYDERRRYRQRAYRQQPPVYAPRQGYAPPPGYQTQNQPLGRGHTGTLSNGRRYYTPPGGTLPEGQTYETPGGGRGPQSNSNGFN